MIRRTVRPLTLASTAAAMLPALASPAWSHGVQGRAETPVPFAVFFVAAAVVVIVSFGALGVAWKTPRLERDRWRPAPARLSRIVLSPALTWALRALVLAGLLLLVATAAFGSTLLNRNLAPVSVFVLWWVGLVPLSLLLGNLWRHLNPWASLARLLRAREDTGACPTSWGVWPAAALMVVWAWLELVYPTAADVRLLAAVMVGYSVLTIVAMLRFGTGTWLDSGEVFSVFTGFLASMSPVEVRDTPQGWRLGFRPPALSAARLAERPGLVAFVSVLVGAVSFDGLSGTDVWAARDVAATERLITLGMPPFAAGIVVATLGLLIMTAAAYGAFLGAAAAAGRAAGHTAAAAALATAFAASFAPIVVGYALSHYLTLFVFQSQDVVRLASDPFGTGRDLLGTADHRIDFNVMTPNVIWAFQVGAIVIAHVLGLILAHDKALQLFPQARRAVRSQYAMLVLMVVLTVSGLWFLSEGMNATAA